MPFGQVVIGPPGSGKTTYCAGVQQLLAAADDAAALAASSQQQQQDPQQQQQRRKPAPRRPALVNLDPANDCLPYTPDIDVRELVSLDAVMEELGLGPNGGAFWVSGGGVVPGERG
jgi:GTPase SAR1 family protein